MRLRQPTTNCRSCCAALYGRGPCSSRTQRRRWGCSTGRRCWCEGTADALSVVVGTTLRKFAQGQFYNALLLWGEAISSADGHCLPRKRACVCWRGVINDLPIATGKRCRPNRRHAARVGIQCQSRVRSYLQCDSVCRQSGHTDRDTSADRRRCHDVVACPMPSFHGGNIPRWYKCERTREPLQGRGPETH